jgi:hypothetical protein
MSSFGAMALGEECQQGPTGRMQRWDPQEVLLQAGSALTFGERPPELNRSGLRVRSQVTQEGDRISAYASGVSDFNGVGFRAKAGLLVGSSRAAIGELR